MPDDLDVLSPLLRTARMRSGVHGALELTAPWGFIPAHRSAAFYVVQRGMCILTCEGIRAPVVLAAGDIAFLPGPVRHALKDSVRTRPIAAERLFGACQPTHARTLVAGGGGAPTTLLVGAFELEGPGSRQLRAALPPVVHVSAASHTGRWAAGTQLQMCTELSGPGQGSSLLADRLAEVLMVQVLREHIATYPGEGTSFLRAMADPQLGAALAAIHAEPAAPWTVATLARRAGRSRSGFAAHFKAALGVSPLEYLSAWRMDIAADLLARSGVSVGEAAERVGYRGQAAFSRAFKSRVGVPPRSYQRTHATAVFPVGRGTPPAGRAQVDSNHRPAT